jgi:hypothetical protein
VVELSVHGAGDATAKSLGFVLDAELTSVSCGGNSDHCKKDIHIHILSTADKQQPMQKSITLTKMARTTPNTSRVTKLPTVMLVQYPIPPRSARQRMPRTQRMTATMDKIRTSMLQQIRVHGSLSRYRLRQSTMMKNGNSGFGLCISLSDSRLDLPDRMLHFAFGVLDLALCLPWICG